MFRINKSTLFRQQSLATALFLAITGLVLLAFFNARQTNHVRRERLFAIRSSLATDAITTRMNDYIQILEGCKGLFTASDTITREDWKSYIKTLNVYQHFPGIQGIGYAIFIKPEDLAEHEKRIKNEGFPDYKVYPVGKREIYSSIIFIEPFEGRNLRAFGFDMYQEPIRQRAMALARDIDEPVLSGKVTLVQETDNYKQPGFLLYLPIYNKTHFANTTENRRKNIIGYVYSPFRSYDLIHSILKKDFQDLNVKIYDGEGTVATSLLYKNFSSNSIEVEEKDLTRKVTVRIAGRTWTILYAPTVNLTSLTERNQPLLILSGGLIIALLVYISLLSFSNTRERAVLLAKDMTKALKESEEQIYKILHHAPDAVVVINARQEIIFWNPKAKELFGWEESEIKGKTLHESIIPSFQNIAIEEIRKSLKNDESELRTAIETQGQKKEGKVFDIELSISSTFDKENPLFIAFISDISERKRAIEELNRQISFNENLIKAQSKLGEGVSISEGGKLIYANEALTQISGYSKEELLELSSFFELVVPEEKKKFAAEVNNPEAANGYTAESLLLKKDLTIIPITFSRIRMKKEDGKDQTITISRDITRQKKIEREILQKTIDLERSNIELKQFASVASHDLKEPLRKIMLFSELLLSEHEESLPENIKPYLDKISVSSKRMQVLIEDLLTYSRIGAREQYFVATDLTAIISEIVSDLEITIKEKEAVIESTSLPVIEGIPGQMRQLFQNLISNALKFNKSGTTPLIRISSREMNTSELSNYHYLKGEGKFCEISISDNGIGFDKKYAEKIFVIFQRLHSKEEYEGTGIGLAICKKIVEFHNGIITVNSEPGMGTTFKIILPVKQKSSELNI